MHTVKQKIFLLAILIIAGTSTIYSQQLYSGDLLCPEFAPTIAPDGTLTFNFPFDPGFDISEIEGTQNNMPPFVTYTGSGSFTGPSIYTLENPSPMFPIGFGSISDTLAFNFTGTGNILCVYGPIIPLELISFTGRTTEQNTNLLEWITATESNTQWIVLERSADASIWETVERLPAQGWSATITEYSVEDYNPYLMTYYRLRMIDLDGMEYFSGVIALERNSLSGVTIAPIPAKNEVFLQFDTAEEGEIIITIIDIHGRQLMQKIVTTTIGLNTIEIDLRAYTSGIYFVSLDNGEDQQTKRILKQQ